VRGRERVGFALECLAIFGVSLQTNELAEIDLGQRGGKRTSLAGLWALEMEMEEEMEMEMEMEIMLVCELPLGTANTPAAVSLPQSRARVPPLCPPVVILSARNGRPAARCGNNTSAIITP